MTDIDKEEIFAASVTLRDRFEAMAVNAGGYKSEWQQAGKTAVAVAETFDGTRAEYLADLVAKLRSDAEARGPGEPEPLIELKCRVVEDLIDDGDEPAVMMDEYDW